MNDQTQASRIRRCTGYVSVAALTCFLLCGATSPETCNVQPAPAPSHTGAEVAGVAIIAGVVIGTVVLVHVHHSHHEVKGCIISGPDGLKLETPDDHKDYKLTGDVALVHEGEMVKIKGDKIKKTKDATDEGTFLVQKIGKDYGPCKASATPAAGAVARPEELNEAFAR